MRNKRKICLVLLYIVVICFLLCLSVTGYIFFSYKEKVVHLSFDDVSECIKNITNDSTSFNSIFDHTFFAELLELHERTGAKFTLYVYEHDDNYNISQFPQKFAHEFNTNKDWLKIGYHAKNPSISKDSISDYTLFTTSFCRVDSILNLRVLGAKSDMLRLHYFFATREEVFFLHKYGVRSLLSADDDRLSYSLSYSQNAKLTKREVFTLGG